MPHPTPLEGLLVNVTAKVRPCADVQSDRVLAYGSVLLDEEFVVHELRVVDGNKGPFVAMPTRKVRQPCPACRTKNHLLANFCNHCGGGLTRPDPLPTDGNGHARLHYDIAHPTSSLIRDMVSRVVLGEYELQRKAGACKE